MAIPERIKAESLADYFDVMSKAIFQAGLRWSMIEAKWPAFRRAFANFDPAKVAAFKDKDIRRLAEDASIIRTEKKIAATVQNARTMLELDQKFGGFQNYLHAFDTYAALSADLQSRFMFLGELSVYYFLFRVNEPVPPFEEWVQTVPGDHPRMREMVAQAQQSDQA